MTAGDESDLPFRALASSLVRSALGLGSNTARMLGVEASDVAQRVGRRLALLVVSTALLTAASVCLLAAAALFVHESAGMPRWAAAAVVGVVALTLAAAGLRVAVVRLVDPDVTFPKTRGELSKDVKALTRAVGEA